MDNHKFNKYFNKCFGALVETITKKHQTDEQNLATTLGLFLRDIFGENDQFSNIKEQCELFLPDKDDYDSDDDLDSEIAQTGNTESIYASTIPRATNAQSEVSFMDRWENEVERGV